MNRGATSTIRMLIALPYEEVLTYVFTEASSDVSYRLLHPFPHKALT
jgi:hypothetical protein